MNAETYEIRSEFHHLAERNLLMALYQPVKKTERSQIAVIQIHSGQYVMSFPPLVNLARHGYTVIGVPLGQKNTKDRMLDMKAVVTFARRYPGIKKVVFFGHSQGGCLTSAYQYIAENGTDRFKKYERIVPFPDIESLPPVDGLMLVDVNYGIMSVLALDPAVKSLNSGFARIPELDLYNPENGYAPGYARYTKDFIDRFQKAQIKYYNDLLATAQQRMEDIKARRGMFCDDEVFVIPGAGGGSSSNKLFIQDNSLLNHTREPRPLLHSDGTVTNEIVHTVRIMNDAPHSDTIRGCVRTTVKDFLAEQFFFDDFGYDDCSMWGANWDSNYLSSRANVRGIHIPLLCQGNTGSHEFINVEHTFDEAASEDKEIIMVEGSDHGFLPVHATEMYPNQFGDPAATFAAYAAEWLAKPGRFLD